jgi:hypothetical protein
VLSGAGRILLLAAAHRVRILALVFMLDARGAEIVRRDLPRTRDFGAGYLPTGFSRWPPNWNRIADSSLFW